MIGEVAAVNIGGGKVKEMPLFFYASKGLWLLSRSPFSHLRLT